MELSELTAYAEEKFHIQEQHKWTAFPGFSVMTDPGTGKWIALLMRQWDSDRGEEIQCCDLKCGQQILSDHHAPFLSLPFRMKGKKWLGVMFDDRTDPETVFRLFDRAVFTSESRGYTMVLDDLPVKWDTVCGETSLPETGKKFPMTEIAVPDKIRQMQRLYRHGDGSFAQKCKNFYLQGKFMEDYEDDEPWDGEYKRYFPTYHDLNLRQLRGYFTWRTQLRKGNFTPVTSSLAYIYIYELLNGIGTHSPEESLRKMQEFERGFLDSGIGDPRMRKNIHNWMLEYAVTRNISRRLIDPYIDSSVLKRDAALAALRKPDDASDDEIFSAMCTFAGKKAGQSPVMKKDGKRGKHLFALTWRLACRDFDLNGEDLFTACFGKQHDYLWHPLGNAVYWSGKKYEDADYVLDASREYHCCHGVWKEKRYDPLYFNRNRFRTIVHETDRVLRKYLKTGRYLHEMQDGTWALPFVQSAVHAVQQEEQEAARSKISIDFSHLEHIRQDADITQDHLLAEDERCAEPDQTPETQPAEVSVPLEKDKKEDRAAMDTSAAMNIPNRHILLALLQNRPVEAYLRAAHLMPSMAADAINEALFDEIGDNILECDGYTITLVPEYQKDVLQLLGGKHDE